MSMTHYSMEFKDQALKLSDDIGLKEASQKLGVKYGTLSGWRKKRAQDNTISAVADSSPLTEREKQLEKEVQELKEANEILKDALGFFAKDRKK